MKRFSLATLALCLFAALAFAQGGSTGRLVGTVTDPSGAVIPGATLTIKDNQTGRERTATASGEGSFDVSQLEFGTYTVTVTAPNYSTFTATELKIDANREYTLSATLQAGGVQESVTVIAGADIINAANAELSNTVSPRQVKELPINGRNPLSLLNTLPGVNATSASINGQRSSSVNYTRDGVNVQDNFIRTGGFVSDRPTVDDTGEFTVITQNAGAQFGSGSTQVQLVTPRGGEDFHGALFAFNRNSEFGANTFFNNRNVDAQGVGVRRPFLNRNQFGGTLSGPSVLPHFGEGGSSVLRKRAFFFVNYEGLRQAQQASASATTLLPQARNGTFSFIDNTGAARTVNVLTGAGLNLTGTNGTTFNNAGGALVVDPLIQSRILNQLPTAGNGTTTGINLTQVVNFNVGVPSTRNAVTGRYDIQFNDTNALNLVVKRNRENNARSDIPFGFSTSTFGSQGGPTTLITAAYNMSPTPSVSNEVRFGFQRSQPFFTGGNVPTDFLIGGASGLPLITNPEGSFRDQGRNTDYYTVQDNATYTIGNHSIRFGGQFQSYKVVALNLAGTTPTFLINNTSNPNAPTLATGLFPGGINTTDLARANQLRFLLAGSVGSGSVRANVVNAQSGFQLGATSVRDLRYKNFAPYVQDQFRISPKLTVNYGLRYELYTPLRNPDQIYLEPRSSGQSLQQTVLDPNGVYQLVGGNAGKAGNFFREDRNNFAPNLSFAYSPTFKNFLGGLFPGEGKTVIRGGFRISYNSDEYIRAPDAANLNNIGVGSTDVNATQNGSSQLGAGLTAGANAFFAPLPSNFVAPSLPTLPRAFAANNTATVASRFGTVSLVDPNLQVPRVMEYNFGIQRELGYQTAIEINYVGSSSRQLVRTIDFNQIDIRSNGFLTDFIRAQQNLAANRAINPQSNVFLTAPGSTTTNLTLIPSLLATPAAGGTALTSTAVALQLQNGTPADLAFSAIQNGATGGIPFLANPNTGVANVLTNGGKFRYNSLQAEIRRRFANGFSFQANYTFQKILTDSTQETQTNVDPFLDNANPNRNYARADYDRTHSFNANTNIELPFGRGRRFLSDGIASKIFGGFQFTGLLNISSGAPISIRDPRGTLNRAVRSNLQPATSSLTTNEIKKLVGIFKTPNGVFFIDPSVLQATASNGVTSQVVDLRQPLPAGFSNLVVRGASAAGSAPFSGQVFSQNAPGSTGNLPINFINGPKYYNFNGGFFRNFRITETKRLQLRMEAFNVLNTPLFFTSSGNNANSTGESSGIFDVNNTSFGRITGTFAPRIVQFGARFDF